MAYTFDENLISDLHKDAYGFRPSQSFWATFAASNGDQKQAIWDDLLETLEATVAHERQLKNAAIKQFNQVLDTLYQHAAKNFEDAIKYLHQAYDTDGDDEYLEFKMGLPFGHIRKARCDADVVTA